MEGVKRGRPVYGIYIGWRGRVFPGWLNTFLTFWERKSIAQAVGKGGVSDILLRLEFIKKKYKYNDNTLVITGHSFGAASLLSGLNEILLQRILKSKYKREEHSDQQNNIEYFADGVVLVNPAIEASQIFQTYENAMELNIDKENRRSLITIITSEDDSATRFLFPIGQTLDTMFTKQEQLERDYTPHEISEYDLDTTTIGHYKPFHTGNLIDSKTIENNKYLSKLLLGSQKSEQSKISNEKKFNFEQFCNTPQPVQGNRTVRTYAPVIRHSVPAFRSPTENSTFRRYGPVYRAPAENDIFSSIDDGDLLEGKSIKMGYVDCCKNPKACILSNKNNNTICNKNIPLSFIYTNKVLIENHNDVFNNDFLAFLLSGVTGNLINNKDYCHHYYLHKENEITKQVAELIEGCRNNGSVNLFLGMRI
ncbi:MAG: hypothetical protein D3909_15670 [Candidatus Electrothrix sp. ATG1]|nr:hypothetical protein [Candidatus Electrothrix sp. ATG1]